LTQGSEKTNKTNAKIYEGAVNIGIIECSIKKTWTTQSVYELFVSQYWSELCAREHNRT